MKCLKCVRESKKGELVVAVYQTRSDGRVPTSSQFSAGFVHLGCPPGVIVKDNRPYDGPPIASQAAIKYVQEHAGD